MKNKMVWILSSVAILITAVIIFFMIPYSITEDGFQKDVQRHSEQSIIQLGVFTEQDIEVLPVPVQNHFRVAGYIDIPKMESMTACVQSASLRESNGKSPMNIRYTVYSFAHTPIRLAYIKSSILGIPFEVYDSTQNGIGFMKGVVAKLFTIFNETGPEMDKSQLLTYLSECFLVPSSIISEYITWEPIDVNHVKAAIAYKGVSGSGIFTFYDNGLVQSFFTSERARIETNGKIDYPGWSIVYEDYYENNGVCIPKTVKTIWHEDDGDLVYFYTNNFNITFDSFSQKKGVF